MSDIFQHNENKSRIAKNIADSYSETATIEPAVQQTQTPFEHQQLLKAQIAGSFNTENALSSEELEKSADDFLQKGGKRAVIGEKRMFGGREYIKTASGWKFHGKGSGSKATSHREEALNHHVETGKGVGEKKDHPSEATLKTLEDSSKDVQAARDASSTSIQKQHNKHKQAMDEGATEVEADQIARGKRNVGDHSGKKENQKPINMVSRKMGDSVGKNIASYSKAAGIVKKEKELSSKHIRDMSLTEMKTQADKLGISTQGKTKKQVVKELSDANVDKQIAEFKDKKATASVYYDPKKEYVQITDDKLSSEVQKKLKEEGIAYTTSTGKGIGFNSKNWKKVKQIVEEAGK